MVSSTFHQIQNNFSNWNVLYAVLFEKQIYNNRTFNGKNWWIIKKVTVLENLFPHLATRGTYSPGDWRRDEAWREQTLVYPPVMCQQRLIYCTWELKVMLFRGPPPTLTSWTNPAVKSGWNATWWASWDDLAWAYIVIHGNIHSVILVNIGLVDGLLGAKPLPEPMLTYMQ